MMQKEELLIMLQGSLSIAVTVESSKRKRWYHSKKGWINRKQQDAASQCLTIVRETLSSVHAKKELHPTDVDACCRAIENQMSGVIANYAKNYLSEGLSLDDGFGDPLDPEYRRINGISDELMLSVFRARLLICGLNEGVKETVAYDQASSMQSLIVARRLKPEMRKEEAQAEEARPVLLSGGLSQAVAEPAPAYDDAIDGDSANISTDRLLNRR